MKIDMIILSIAADGWLSFLLIPGSATKNPVDATSSHHGAAITGFKHTHLEQLNLPEHNNRLIGLSIPPRPSRARRVDEEASVARASGSGDPTERGPAFRIHPHVLVIWVNRPARAMSSRLKWPQRAYLGTAEGLLVARMIDPTSAEGEGLPYCRTPGQVVATPTGHSMRYYTTICADAEFAHVTLGSRRTEKISLDMPARDLYVSICVGRSRWAISTPGYDSPAM